MTADPENVLLILTISISMSVSACLLDHISSTWYYYIHIYLHFLLLHLCLSHSYFTFLVFFFLPICLIQLNNTSGNEKNKPALSEDFSDFHFSPWCYRRCITYFKSASVVLLCQTQTTLPCDKVISELTAMASSDSKFKSHSGHWLTIIKSIIKVDIWKYCLYFSSTDDCWSIR